MAVSAAFAGAVVRREDGNGDGSSNAKPATSTQTAGYPPAVSEIII